MPKVTQHRVNPTGFRADIAHFSPFSKLCDWASYFTFLNISPLSWQCSVHRKAKTNGRIFVFVFPFSLSIYFFPGSFILIPGSWQIHLLFDRGLTRYKELF